MVEPHLNQAVLHRPGFGRHCAGHQSLAQVTIDLLHLPHLFDTIVCLARTRTTAHAGGTTAVLQAIASNRSIWASVQTSAMACAARFVSVGRIVDSTIRISSEDIIEAAEYGEVHLLFESND